MGLPAARVGDNHLCPKVEPGPVPHVGGPILPTGCITVLIGGMPAARVGDKLLCVGPPDTIKMGSDTVRIGGKKASRIFDCTEHGGAIVVGWPTVLIGGAAQGSCLQGAAASGAAFVRQAPPGGKQPPPTPTQTPAPTPTAAPSPGNSLLNDKNVAKGMKDAATDSDIGGKNPVEHGGFILKDPKTGSLSVERWPQGQGASMKPPMSTTGQYNGQDIVGSFHTHPNIGPGWQQSPSNADINFVKNYPKTTGPDHFVISRDNIYHIDNSGTVSTVGKTTSILK